MSPSKKKKNIRKYKKERKKLILQTLQISEDEMKAIKQGFEQIGKYADLVQQLDPSPLTENQQVELEQAMLSIMAKFGSLGINPAMGMMHILALSLKQMSEDK